MRAKRYRVYVQARVRPDEHERWVAEAARRDLSLSQLVRFALRQVAAERPRPEAAS